MPAAGHVDLGPNADRGISRSDNVNESVGIDAVHCSWTEILCRSAVEKIPGQHGVALIIRSQRFDIAGRILEGEVWFVLQGVNTSCAYFENG